MQFEQDKTWEGYGNKTGYVFGYFLFTTILYLILFFLKKMPETWQYWHIMILTLAIVIIGRLMNKAVIQ